MCVCVMVRKMLNEVLECVYVIGRGFICTLGCVYILLTIVFCIVHFWLTLGVSAL